MKIEISIYTLFSKGKDKNMKKKIFVCALIAICLSIVAVSTAAFDTYNGKSTNVITVGNIKIELQQLSAQNEGEEPSFSAENEFMVHPGVEISKTVQVKNVGNNPAWIRISVEKVISLAEEISATPNTDLIGFDIDTEHWTLKDGYYYYTEALEPEQTTYPLFTKIQFSAQMDNIYQKSTANVDIKVHAVQVAHNGETVFEASGWPADE